MATVRQQQRSEEVRNRILEIAQKILLEEGVHAVSVRRVAKEMDYTAPIVYHYFRDKKELLSCAIREGYRKILTSVKWTASGLAPDEELRESFKYFVEGAMRIPNAYKSFILNFSSDEFLAESAVLVDNKDEPSPTLAHTISTIEAGVKSGLFAPCDVKLTAKVYWSAMFGLFFRLVVESDISPEECEQLIQRQSDILLKGISF